jgi:hypothetical protein
MVWVKMTTSVVIGETTVLFYQIFLNEIIIGTGHNGLVSHEVLHSGMALSWNRNTKFQYFSS